MFGLPFPKKNNISDGLMEVVERIQQGDEQLRNQFIRDYTPFILKTVSKFTRSYIDVYNSEEYSVGLIAFNEAIDCYDTCKRTKFTYFAKEVIQRRLIDHLRKVQRNVNTLPFSYFDDMADNTEEYDNNFIQIAIDNSNLDKDGMYLFDYVESKEEIAVLSKKLSHFGLTIRDIGMNSPKHNDSIRLAIGVARLIAENNILYEKMFKKKKIPMTELLKYTPLYHKTIERNRKFIIGISLILRSNLNIMKCYLKVFEKGGGIK